MSMKNAKALVLTIAAAAASLFGATAAHAGVTHINAGYASEDGINQILAHQYGGVFGASGDNWSNGSVTATRVNDDSDQIWSTGFVAAEAVARFAGYSQSFGIFSGASGGSFAKLFDVSGFGYGVSGAATELSLGSIYRLARAGDAAVANSHASENGGGADHMVTYQINGLNDHTSTYMVFFEDGGDGDFNDLSVQLKTAAVQGPPNGQAVPLPAAAWMGLSTLAGGGIVGGARRIRRRLA